MYSDTEENCRKYSVMISYYVPFHQMIVLPPLLKTFFNIIIGNRDSSTWELPYPISVPFDSAIMWQWYIIWFYDLSIGIAYGYIVSLITMYFISFCLYISGICNQFDLLIDSIQTFSEENKTEKSFDEIQKRTKLMLETLSKAINVQVKAFEYVDINV